MSQEQPDRQDPSLMDPLRRDIRSPGTWHYLGLYLVLGCSALIILMKLFDIGSNSKMTWGLPLLGIVLSVFMIQRQHAREKSGR